jgi:RHS repeat-associated protein
VTALVDESGTVVERYSYSPYGERTVLDADFSADANGLSDVDNALGHQGLHLDTESALYYNRNRYFSPALGRFIARDPLGYVDGMSVYQYAKSSPLDLIDPAGHWGRKIHYGYTWMIASLLLQYNCPKYVASAANYPDESKYVRSGEAGVMDVVGAALAGKQHAIDRVKVMAEWHFPADPDGVVRPDSRAARSKVEKAIEVCNLWDFGEGLHVFQDSWAHQGRPRLMGVGHWRGASRGSDGGWTNISGSNTAALTSKAGHADDIEAWPEDARTTILRTYDYMLEFAQKCPCACPEVDGMSRVTKGPWVKTVRYDPVWDRDELERHLNEVIPGKNVLPVKAPPFEPGPAPEGAPVYA